MLRCSGAVTLMTVKGFGVSIFLSCVSAELEDTMLLLKKLSETWRGSSNKGQETDFSHQPGLTRSELLVPLNSAGQVLYRRPTLLCTTSAHTCTSLLLESCPLTPFQHLSQHPHQRPILQRRRHPLLVPQLLIHLLRRAMRAFLDPHIHPESWWESILKPDPHAKADDGGEGAVRDCRSYVDCKDCDGRRGR